jgi:hypothetical protein
MTAAQVFPFSVPQTGQNLESSSAPILGLLLSVAQCATGAIGLDVLQAYVFFLPPEPLDFSP